MPHASITTVQAGSCTKKTLNAARDRRRLSATLPGSCDTAMSKTAFAMSTATTLCFSTGSSLFPVTGATLAHRCRSSRDEEESISSMNLALRQAKPGEGGSG